MNSASLGFEAERHSWRATAGRDTAGAFRRARRHSRFVRFLRYGVPGVVGAIILFNMLAAWLDPLSMFAKLPGLGQLGISGTRITMETPRLAGYTSDGRGYELTAAAAAQDLKRPQFIELQEVRAKIALQDGNLVNISAATGLYDTKSEAVTLRKNVVVATSDGVEIRLMEAFADIRKGSVISEHPVDITMPTGRVQAEKMEVVDSGAIIRFRGNVKMDMRAQPPAAQGNGMGPTR